MTWTKINFLALVAAFATPHMANAASQAVIPINIQRDWLDWLSAALVPSIGLLAAWIALRQNHTDRNRLRLELLERRLAIYDVLERAGIEVGGFAQVLPDTMKLIFQIVPQSRFLFSNKISTFCMRILEDCDNLNFYYKQQNENPNGANAKAFIDLHKGMLDKLKLELDPNKLSKQFSPELRIEEKLARSWIKRSRY